MSNSDSRSRSKLFDWELEKRRRRDTLVDGVMPVASDVRELAQNDQATAPPPASTPAVSHLTFRIGTLRVAVPLSEVLAVIPAREGCFSLGAREFFRETISFRSRGVALADVASMFGFRHRSEPGSLQDIIILEFLGRLVGIRADEVVGPSLMDDTGLARDGLKQGGRYARGFTPDLVLILDVPRLIAAAHGGR